MKKIIASLALAAALGAGFAAGAQAQVTSRTPGLYSLTVGETSATLGPSLYQYNYTFTLTSTTPGYHIDDVNFTGFQGYVFGSALVTASGGTGFTPNPLGVPDFTAPSGAGFSTVGQSATFQLESTLPPAVSGLPVTVSTNADISPPDNNNRAGSGQLPGPGPAVPEAGSFALIGLGLLPIGLLVRRRISRRAE